MEFQQQDFEYKDLFSEDSYLADLLAFYSSASNTQEIASDLSQFSKQACGEILQLMWRAERNQPELKQFDHWGKRVDQIMVDPAWEELHRVAAREGMVAIGYQRQHGEDSRLHQFLKLMLFHPSSAFYTCPLAMTDGAARVLELENSKLKAKFFDKLTSRDPDEFWTAGQWMTEKAGGSDVSNSETYAEEKEGKYFLYGTKWFTSAITANVSMTLAQTKVDGKNRLSLFLVEIRDQQGQLNNIEVLRLKDKLGTKAMPTAELRLNGVEGHLIGELGAGVKNIATVLNVSRLYNSVCATGTIYRLHSLVRDFSKKRSAFGKLLMDHPLHQEMLLKTQAQVKACSHFVGQMAKLLGRSELGIAKDYELATLRLFTPIIKLWTGKKSVQITSELVEAFGGAGYIEDTQIPRFLRDAQVFSIWEGTTNILSLDTMRALSKGTVLQDSVSHIKQHLQALSDSPNKIKLLDILETSLAWLTSSQSDSAKLERGAREFSFALGDVFCGLLLCEFANSTQKKRDAVIAQVFVDGLSVPQFNSIDDVDESCRQALFS